MSQTNSIISLEIKLRAANARVSELTAELARARKNAAKELRDLQVATDASVAQIKSLRSEVAALKRKLKAAEAKLKNADSE